MEKILIMLILFSLLGCFSENKKENKRLELNISWEDDINKNLDLSNEIIYLGIADRNEPKAHIDNYLFLEKINFEKDEKILLEWNLDESIEYDILVFIDKDKNAKYNVFDNDLLDEIISVIDKENNKFFLNLKY